MKLSDLSDLIQVRNHLEKIVNTSRANRNLMNLVAQMDKVFTEGVEKLDIKNLFEKEMVLVKVGNNPSDDDLEYWRKVFEEAQYDKDFAIFTDSSVEVQKVKIDPDDAIGIKATEIKILPTREVVSKSGQMGLNFADKPTHKEEKEIRESLKKLPAHVTPTEEGIEKTSNQLGADEKLVAEVKQDVKKVMEDEDLQAQKDEVDQKDEKEIALKVAEAKAKISKRKKNTKKAAFSRPDTE